VDEFGRGLNLLGDAIGEDEFAENGEGKGEDEEVVYPEAALVEEAVFVSVGELLGLFFVHTNSILCNKLVRVIKCNTRSLIINYFIRFMHL
jgi:hypothetical protein